MESGPQGNALTRTIPSTWACKSVTDPHQLAVDDPRKRFGEFEAFVQRLPVIGLIGIQNARAHAFEQIDNAAVHKRVMGNVWMGDEQNRKRCLLARPPQRPGLARRIGSRTLTRPCGRSLPATLIDVGNQTLLSSRGHAIGPLLCGVGGSIRPLRIGSARSESLTECNERAFLVGLFLGLVDQQ